MLYDYVLYLRCRGFLMPIIRERLDRLRNLDFEKLPLEDALQPVRTERVDRSFFRGCRFTNRLTTE
jgi:hypothetical protein